MHVSLSFLYSTTLASALYMMLLRYLNRQYKTVVRLVDTVGTDSPLTKEENNILQFTTCENLKDRKNSADWHPDASACRLKISVVMLDAPVKLPWDLSVEMSQYLFRLEHVSADCLLSPDEELTILRKCICDVADKNFDKAKHTALGVTLCKNRRAALRARAAHVGDRSGKMPACTVELPLRVAESSSSWVREWHPNILEETPEQLEAMLEDMVMKFTYERSMYHEGMLALLAMLNEKYPSRRVASQCIRAGS